MELLYLQLFRARLACLLLVFFLPLHSSSTNVFHFQHDQEAAYARRLSFELNQGQLYAEREAILHQKLREIQFEEHLSLHMQQQLNQWELGEAATYQTRLNVAESNYSYAATRRGLEMEKQIISHFQHLRESLTQDEQTYRATIQHEAGLYSSWQQ